MPEKRLEKRSLCSELVDIDWKDRCGWRHACTVVLEDISRRGACLQMEYPIPPKTEITFRADNRSFTCRVCYCIYRDHGYCVGVEFSGPQAWSPGIFRPEHLMDLQQLAQEDEPVTSRAGGS